MTEIDKSLVDKSWKLSALALTTERDQLRGKLVLTEHGLATWRERAEEAEADCNAMQGELEDFRKELRAAKERIAELQRAELLRR